jgi:hypothetical protein
MKLPKLLMGHVAYTMPLCMTTLTRIMFWHLIPQNDRVYRDQILKRFMRGDKMPCYLLNPNIKPHTGSYPHRNGHIYGGQMRTGLKEGFQTWYRHWQKCVMAEGTILRLKIT